MINEYNLLELFIYLIGINYNYRIMNVILKVVDELLQIVVKFLMQEILAKHLQERELEELQFLLKLTIHVDQLQYEL